MEIFIEDIPDEGLEINASEADPWLKAVLKDAFGDLFEDGDKAKLDASIFKVGGHVNLDGRLSLTCHHDCDRCLLRYKGSSNVHLHTVLAPLNETRRHEKDDEELVKEDLDFCFYEGDCFDFGEIVREQILLSEPMKHLCKPECKGLCQQCGKNLNDGPCACPKKISDSRFAVLKNVKLKNKAKG